MGVPPGCDPKPGYVFLKGQTGDAVRLEDCPQKTSPKKMNEFEFTFCSIQRQ